MSFFADFVQGALKKAGIQIRRIPAKRSFEPAMDRDFQTILGDCHLPHYQSVERLFALYEALVYIVKHKIPGDIVECGVYKGMTPLFAAATLGRLGDTGRKIFLYDTYEGMPPAGPEDIEMISGKSAEALKRERGDKPYSDYSRASIEEVRNNISGVKYPQENFVFVKGLVEKTIPGTMPQQIALLRLDTDWYESTYHELKHLYPRVSARGVLIVDDYGHWAGAKKAVDLYFKETGQPIFLSRVDYTCRLGIKPG